MSVLNNMVKNILNKEFSQIREKNKAFSLRAYARKLSLAGPELSTFLNDKRKFSNNKIIDIINRTKVDQSTKKKIIEFIKSHELLFNVYSVTTLFNKVNEHSFDQIKDWYYYAILCLLEKSPQGLDTQGIIKKINIDENCAQDALDKLCEMELIYLQDGAYHFGHKYLTTSKNTKSQSLREHHRQYIEKAIESIEGTDVKERSISGMTFCIDKSKVKEAFEMIDNFRQYFGCYFSTGDTDSVYRINIQFFPVIKDGQDKVEESDSVLQ